MAYTSRLSVLLLLGFVLLLPGGAQAQQPSPQMGADDSILDDTLVRFQAKKGLDHLYDMRFDQAQVLFDQITRRYPDHPIGPFLNALNVWWKILIDIQNTSHDATFFAAMDEVIERADEILKRDPNDLDAMFFKGAALGFRGRHRSNRGDWFKAAKDGKRAMDYVLGVAERAPENDDYVFGKGIYDYYAAVIPDRYPYAKPVMVFFPKGDRERGLRELQRTAEDGYYIQTEAVYFLLQIYYLFERDFDESVERVQWLRRKHPNNPFFHTLEGRIYARWGHWDRSQEVFSQVIERWKEGRTGYTDAAAEQSYYYIGRGLLVQDRFEEALEALQQLERLTQNDQDGYFKTLGRLRQGMAYDAVGRRDQARSRYAQVLQMPDHAGAHDRARRYLQEPYRG